MATSNSSRSFSVLSDETKRKEMKAKVDELKAMLAEPAPQGIRKRRRKILKEVRRRNEHSGT